ncbi:MAG: Ig-like domain-containing protein [Clostridia bacterium]|nr:Ig-like domain-containing protein [Clostridia bacterium]
MKKASFFVVASALTLLLTGAVGCNIGKGNGGGTASSSEEEKATPAIAISNKTASLEQGDAYDFDATLTALEGEVVWSVGENGVLSIDTNGVVVALKAGETTVTATCGTLADSVSVTVSDTNRPIVLTNEAQTVELFLGDTYKANPSVVYKGEVAESGKIEYSYSSSDRSVATVATDGTVTGVAVGSATITITTEYRFFSISATYDVNIVAESYVAFTNEPNVTLGMVEHGGYVTEKELSYKVVIDGATKENVTVDWSVEDESIVAVENGNVSALKPGETKVRITYTDGTATHYADCVVKVVKPDIRTGLTFDYEISDALALPAYSIADFAAENVESVFYNGVNILKDDKTIDKDLCVGASATKSWIVETGMAKYEVSARVYNAIVTTAEELDSVTDRLAKIPVQKGNESQGYYYDGYVVFDGDIDYANNSFSGIASMEACGASKVNVNGFKGAIDGRGHTLSNLVFDKANTAFVWNLLDGASVTDLNFVDCTVSAQATAVVAAVMNKAILSDVYVKGTLVPVSAAIESSDNARGLVVARVVKSGATIKNVTAEAATNFGMLAMTGVFGYLANNNTNTFNGCLVINATVLYGSSNGESDTSVFTSATSDIGITVYNSYGEYYEYLGYELVESESIAGNCISKGKEVYRKAGEEDIVVDVPAFGHNIENDVCTYCEKAVRKMDAIDVDVKNGFNVSALFGGRKVAYVTSDDVSIPVSGGVITYARTDVSMTPRYYVITLEDGNIYTLNVTVWSLLISNEKELRSMNDYLTFGPKTSGGDGYTYVEGYFKMDANVTLTEQWTNKEAVGSSVHANVSQGGTGGFHGIFEGNGKTIYNLNVVAGASGLFYGLGGSSVIRNLSVYGSNPTSSASSSVGTGLISKFIYGGTYENITAELHLLESATGQSAGGLFGTAYYDVYAPVTMKNVTILARADVSGSIVNNPTLFGLVGVTNISRVTLENITVAGFGNFVANWQGKTSTLLTYKTQAALEEFGATCTNIRMFETVAAYEEYLDSVYTNETLETKRVNYLEALDVQGLVGDKTIVSVTEGGLELALDEGKLYFKAMDVDTTKTFVIVTADDYRYTVAVEIYKAVTDLGTFETDVETSFDVLNALPQGAAEIETVTFNGENVELESGVLKLTADYASDQAKVFYVNTIDGKTYKFTLTVWTLLVSSEEEWATINSEYLGITGENNPNSLKGYFKLDADISLTVNSTNRNQYSLGKIDKIANDFAIVLDGGNHTLTWTVSCQDGSIIWATTANTILRNMKIVATINTAGDNDTSVLAYHNLGGTFEDLDVTLNFAYVYGETTKAPSLLGRAGFSSWGKTPGNIVVKNVVVKAGGENEGNEGQYAAALIYDIENALSISKMTLENVTIAGFNSVITVNGKSSLTTFENVCVNTVEGLKTYATFEDGDVKIYATVAEYQATIGQ